MRYKNTDRQKDGKTQKDTCTQRHTDRHKGQIDRYTRTIRQPHAHKQTDAQTGNREKMKPGISIAPFFHSLSGHAQMTPATLHPNMIQSRRINLLRARPPSDNRPTQIGSICRSLGAPQSPNPFKVIFKIALSL